MKDQEARERITVLEGRLHALAIRVYALEQNGEICDIPFQNKTITLKEAILMLTRHLGVRFNYTPDTWKVAVMPKPEGGEVYKK